MKKYSLKTFFRGSAAYVAAKLGGAVLSFVFTPYVLHRLGSDQFALWAILGSAVGYVSLFDMGLSQSFTRFLAEKRAVAPSEASGVLYTGVAFYVLVGCVLVPISILLAPYIMTWLNISPELQKTGANALVVMVAYFSVTNLGALGRSSLDAMQRVDIGQSVSLAGIVTYWVLGVALIWYGLGIWSLVIAAVAGQLLVIVVSLVLLRRSWPEVLVWRGFAPWSEIRRLMSFGAGLQVGATATTINLETDRLVIGKFVSMGAVTSYELGNMLARMVRSLPQAFLHSALPIVTDHVSREGSDSLRDSLESAARAYSGVGFFLAGGMTAVAPVLLSFWIGSPQHLSAQVLAILAFGWAFVSATGVATTVMRARGRVRLEASYTFGMALVNVAVTVILVRPFGVLGVVAGTSIGAVIASLAFMYAFAHAERLGFWRHIIEVIGRPLAVTTVSTALVFGASYFLGVSDGVSGRLVALGYLIPLGVLYVAVWLALSVALSVYSISDIRAVRARMKAE